MTGEIDRPSRGDVGFWWRWDGWKIIAIRIVRIVGIAVVCRQGRKRHVLWLAVQVHNTVFQVQPIARNSNHPLYQEQLGFTRFVEHNDVAATNITVIDERSPPRRRSECD